MGVIVVLTLSYFGSIFLDLNQRLEASGITVYSSQGQPFEELVYRDIDGPLNILAIGSDTRENQGANYGDHEGELADVIILLHVSEDRKNAVAISFPRDLMVPVPECPNPAGGENYPARELMQINATLSTGGPACTLLAVQQLTGLDIPHLAMIDFKGVIAMTNEVGGVEVCVANDIKDKYSKLNLAAGEHILKGEEALAFLRTRHGVGDGSDLSRISNQQVYLTSLVRKFKSEGTLTNPFRMFALANAAVDNMTLSNGLANLTTIISMARELNDVDLDKILFIKLPVYDMKGEYAGRVGVKEERAGELFARLQADEPLVLAEANPGSGAVIAEPSDQPKPSPTATATDDVAIDPSNPASAPTAIPVLPDWVQGTSAETKTCSD
jgi:LCP family protein required for cell wall assembly